MFSFALTFFIKKLTRDILPFFYDKGKTNWWNCFISTFCMERETDVFYPKWMCYKKKNLITLYFQAVKFEDVAAIVLCATLCVS